jgi:hypothetical protein
LPRLESQPTSGWLRPSGANRESESWGAARDLGACSIRAACSGHRDRADAGGENHAGLVPRAAS